ncbi:hypothetical protein PICMEDRAFT_52853 [Pichia membranifaciens NRRL Y-2026]|uniref:Major facilitator superfamily (MFS) profile domain-containing protein n=1 Tax=Pichia membranifaciens NRRL Y-2026 TaxID=763406 RepID=A0A1E3NL86_9ASCO|nr:hypothetical protein PICMEDRAFT_52853 [Pichia membranifaciens NRRL Y-2026]ODQ46894.1 hypothetical protein PICMEDRAFT_52853 [Pichia membranifaciens NRRL Y-2026]
MTHFLLSLKQSSADIRLLWFSVFIRMISFGLTNQVLASYLKELGISEVRIGMFMSMTMVGDSIISYVLTWNANKIGNRFIMLLGSALMILASGIFSTGTSNFGYLLFAAIVGVISPSGGDTGPFKTIEETVLANLTPPNHRPEIFAIHSTFANVGASLGAFLAGLSVDYFTKSLHLTMRDSYRYTFCILLFTSFLKFVSLIFISHKAEASYIPPFIVAQRELEMEQDAVELKTFTGLAPRTQSILFRLLVPFMLASLGYGFMTKAWVVYYFQEKYNSPAVLLGTLFGLAGIVKSLTSVLSAWLVKQFGPIKSCLLTQIPRGILSILIPTLGVNFKLGSLFFLLHQSTVELEVIPRRIILTTLVEPIELSRVMGTVNIGKQVARSAGPFFTGFFAHGHLLWVCFIISGVTSILVNLWIAANFSDLDQKVKKLEQIQHDIE